MRATVSVPRTAARTESRDGAQHLVPGRVAKGVVRVLELVDVAEQQRRLTTGAAPIVCHSVQLLKHLSPVEQPGEGVEAGASQELGLGGHRLVGERER